MTFNTKLIADYVEFFNEELESIPIKDIEHFDLIANKLEKIILPSRIFRFFFMICAEKEQSIEKPTQDQIDYIAHCYHYPKEYVQSPYHYSEYQKLFKERIQSKIVELRTLTNQEKKDYILFQTMRHKQYIPQVNVFN